MKNNPFVRFIITTVIGGLVFLVPVAFAGYILYRLVMAMVQIAEPLTGWIPVDTVAGVALANLVALGVVIALCFVAGLPAKVANQP